MADGDHMLTLIERDTALGNAVIDAALDCIILMDEDGYIIEFNNASQSTLGYSREEAVGVQFADLILPPALRPTHKTGLSHFLKEGENNALNKRVELPVMTKAGEELLVEMAISAVEFKEKVFFSAYLRDITAKRASEERLLRNAKEAAEFANAEKFEFLANISQEMRAPLNGVIGALSLVERDKLGTEAGDLILAAERSAETLLTLIDDLLDLSRIEAGHVEIEDTMFDPRELSTVMSEVFRPLAEEKDIALSTRVRAPAKPLRADVGKIRQVLINLVGNSLKFTQRGWVDVTIDYQGDDEAGYLKFEVRDTGIGISEADQAMLFDRCKQADSLRTKSHGSAGLGLSICKQLVQIMDGEISVSSSPGVGSTFSVKIPVTCWREDHVTLDDRLKNIRELSGRILIAEDSETNAMIAKKMLDRLGLDFEHVTDGAGAVDAALDGDFDLILMDVSMPHLGGLDATRLLRERGFDKPIIAMTAHPLKGDGDRAVESGMSGYITKPVRPDALRSALQEWLPDGAAEAQGQTVQKSVLDADFETFAQIG